MKHALLITLLTLSACAGYKTPGVSQDPVKMSADTLCFRYASNQSPALEKEITRRDLNCERLLEADPIYQSQTNPGADDRAMR